MDCEKRWSNSGKNGNGPKSKEILQRPHQKLNMQINQKLNNLKSAFHNVDIWLLRNQLK